MKIIRIYSCSECKESECNYDPYLGEHYCLCRKAIKVVLNPDHIPDWCPLEDASPNKVNTPDAREPCNLCRSLDDLDNCNFCPDCGRDLRRWYRHKEGEHQVNRIYTDGPTIFSAKIVETGNLITFSSLSVLIATKFFTGIKWQIINAGKCR